ncbi:MAG: hypothetical protein O7J95_16940 [Planctomycetota bacterium]|nr:hypothetical protein [Planctomycetota bacterium]
MKKVNRLATALVPGFLVVLASTGSPAVAQDPGQPCILDNGDVNADGSRDISDAIGLLEWLFLGGPPPAPGVCVNAPGTADIRERLGGVIGILRDFPDSPKTGGGITCLRNVDTSADFIPALRAIGTSPRTVVIAAKIDVLEDVTVPPNVQLWFTKCGSLKPSGSTGGDPTLPVTVTIQGPILAPVEAGPILSEEDKAIFDVSAGGIIDVEWTGQLVANWWSGGDIAVRWNNMRTSLRLDRSRLPHSHSYKVVGVPEVVTEGTDGFRSVAYGRVVPILVEAIKELNGKLEDKDAELISQRQRLADLASRLERMEATMTKLVEKLPGSKNPDPGLKNRKNSAPG